MITSLYDLGGVQVEVVGPPIVMPRQPEADKSDIIWPTSRMALYTPVLMGDGKRWTVSRVPRYTQAGDVAIQLAAPVPSRAALLITVPGAYLDVPIWWTGVTPPPSGPVGQPTEEHHDTPPPPPEPPPMNQTAVWTG